MTDSLLQVSTTLQTDLSSVILVFQRNKQNDSVGFDKKGGLFSQNYLLLFYLEVWFNYFQPMYFYVCMHLFIYLPPLGNRGE